ncbi:protein kinase [Pelagibius litoralis]|uniref:Protein kinase n=1 Tax=Pelagibius litoralis TaxID=374515 RepID=A0A967KBF4_9PROT|nr:protein kinase [Pelagibius litoralis]NIA72148.1 protein kinase [Pelagibius litoralis]
MSDNSRGGSGVGSTGAADSGMAGVFEAGALISYTYRVEALLARGGMGEVYRTSHTEIGTQHAIKIVRPDLANNDKIMELFRREASVLRTIRDDAVVGYDGVLRDEEGRVYLVMEFVDGPSLTDYIATQGTLDPAEVRDLRDRLAHGLAAAHDKGVIHRDMSPDNVILGDGQLSQAKIIDFGIAKLADSSATTIIGDDFAGRYAYASPEQIGLYGGQVDARSDIYSLGLVLATAGTGKALNMGEISESLVSVIEARKRIPDFSSVPEILRNELGAMLQPDPADRPQTMRDVIGLDARLEAEPEAAPETPTEPQTHKAVPLAAEPAGRPAAAAGSGRPWLWPAVTAGVAIAAAGGYFVWQGSQEAEGPRPAQQELAEVEKPAAPAPAQSLLEQTVPDAGRQATSSDAPPDTSGGMAEPVAEQPAALSAETSPETPVETNEVVPAGAPQAAEAPAEEVMVEEAAAEAEKTEEAVVEAPEESAAPSMAESAGESPEESAQQSTQQSAGESSGQSEEDTAEVAAEAVVAVSPAEPADAGSPAASSETVPQAPDSGEAVAPLAVDEPPASAPPAAVPVEEASTGTEAAEVSTEVSAGEVTAPAAEAPESAPEVAEEAPAPAEQVAALPAPSEAELREAAREAAESGLSREQKREIQQDLQVLGHYPGGIDGSFGPGTRAGIESYQKVAGLEETGYLTDVQRQDLAAAAAGPRAEEALRAAAEKEAAAAEAARASAAAAAEERRKAEDAAARARAIAEARQAQSPAGQQQVVLPDESELDRLRRVAEAGDPIAQASLGLKYYRGEGIRRNLQEAFRWTAKAAEQGEARAQSNLGFYYMNGEGVRRDPAQAARWWQEAAAQGLQQAQFNLGLLYETGQGVSADPEEAAKWYRLALAQGDRQAKSRLDGLIRRGLVAADN